MVRMHHFIALFFIVADSSAQCSSVTSKLDDEVKIKKKSVNKDVCMESQGAQESIQIEVWVKSRHISLTCLGKSYLPAEKNSLTSTSF